MFLREVAAPFVKESPMERSKGVRAAELMVRYSLVLLLRPVHP
jgi:hypothetical protein